MPLLIWKDFYLGKLECSITSLCSCSLLSLQSWRNVKGTLEHQGHFFIIYIILTAVSCPQHSDSRPRYHAVNRLGFSCLNGKIDVLQKVLAASFDLQSTSGLLICFTHRNEIWIQNRHIRTLRSFRSTTLLNQTCLKTSCGTIVQCSSISTTRIASWGKVSLVPDPILLQQQTWYCHLDSIFGTVPHVTIGWFICLHRQLCMGLQLAYQCCSCSSQTA